MYTFNPNALIQLKISVFMKPTNQWFGSAFKVLRTTKTTLNSYIEYHKSKILMSTLLKGFPKILYEYPLSMLLIKAKKINF
jgi:hypothetical protein